MKRIHPAYLSLAMLVACTLAACGGGDGGGDSSGAGDSSVGGDSSGGGDSSVGGDSYVNPFASTVEARTSLAGSLADNSRVNVAYNDAGEGLAVWEIDTGRSRFMMYSFFDGTSWSEEAFATNSQGSRPQIISNGTDFAMGFLGRAYMIEFNATSKSWGGIWTCASSNVTDVNVATDGTDYAIVYRKWDSSDSTYNVYFNVFDGIGCNAEKKLSDGSGEAQTPSIASNGTGYAITWHQWNDALTREEAHGIVDTGTAWTADAVLSTTDAALYPVVASDGANYTTVWAQGGDIYHSVFDGAVWAASTLLADTEADAYSPKIVSNGTVDNYAVAWYILDTTAGANSVYGSLNGGAGWDSPEPLSGGTGAADYSVLASDGTGYGVAWRQVDLVTGIADIYFNAHDGSSWAAEASLESADVDTYNPAIASDDRATSSPGTRRT